MKALVGHIQKFSTEDGPGIRTTVFLKGCPLNCQWCHNPELIGFSQEIIEMPNSCIKCGYCLDHCPQNAVHMRDDGRVRVDRGRCDVCLDCAKFCYAKALQPVANLMTAEEVLEIVLQDKEFYNQTGGGMTISGGEMLAQTEFVKELVKLAGKADVKVCLDTSGYGDGTVLMELARMSNVTTILYDLKAIDDAVHREYTGQSNTLILENLRALASESETCEKLQMRMPLIAGVNDGWNLIEGTASLYRELGLKGVTLLPYHNLGVSKMRNIGRNPIEFDSPTDEYVEKIKAYFETEAGMTVEILGKV